jgi:hypothetical protein
MKTRRQKIRLNMMMMFIMIRTLRKMVLRVQVALKLLDVVNDNNNLLCIAFLAMIIMPFVAE